MWIGTTFRSPVQVFAKTVLGDLLHQIAVAGGDDARVDANRLGVAHTLEFALLQHAEQFDLEFQ